MHACMLLAVFFYQYSDTAGVGAAQVDQNSAGGWLLVDVKQNPAKALGPSEVLVPAFRDPSAAGNNSGTTFFGSAVAIDGGYAIIGAYGQDNGAGAAYIYSLHNTSSSSLSSSWLSSYHVGENSTWQLMTALPSVGGADTYFGYSVALANATGTALVGAVGLVDDQVYLADTVAAGKIGSTRVAWVDIYW